MISNYKDTTPSIGKDTYVAPSADIIGKVTIGSESSVWPNVSIRGDIDSITIGDKTSIQENSTLHISEGLPLTLGNQVTVGHGVILHSCTVGDNTIVGMGAIILDGAVIGENSLVGAGSLVTPGKVFPANSLIMGSPAKVIRERTPEEATQNKEHAEGYVNLAKEYL